MTEILALQEFPEHGGSAEPGIKGQTSNISVLSDCTTASLHTTLPTTWSWY